jgi:hypothetical protein
MPVKKKGAKKQLTIIKWQYSPLKIVKNNGR